MLFINVKPWQISYFWTLVYKTENHWYWEGAINDKGYGYFSRPTIFAHRLSYFLYYDVDPLKQDVLHKCDIPLCINPEHLFLGNQSDNIKDMDKKDRRAKGEFAKSKMLDEEVKQIKQYLLNGERICDLAREHKVNWRTIYDIKKSRTWKHIN